jgi:hypothetical protein
MAAGNFDIGGAMASKLIGSLFGSSLNNTWDPRVYDYYSKHQEIFNDIGADPNADLEGETIRRMQADPTTKDLFASSTPTANATAGGQQVPSAAASTPTTLPSSVTAQKNEADLAGENKTITIAGGSADASATLDDSGKKKRAPTGLASSLGINV